MKISGVEVYKVDVELAEELNSSHTRYQVTQDVYIKITTNEGAIGYGATAPKYYISGETQDTVIAVLKKRLIPVIIGEDPFCFERIHEKMNHAIRYNSAAKAAIDIALYDLAGKYLKIPVYQLLGGAYRKEMPAFDLIGLLSPEKAADRASKRLEAGYQEFKVKVGPDPDMDLKRVEAVNKVVSGRSLKIDANQSWDDKQAVRLIEKFAELGVTVVEQPVPMDDLEGLAMVKNHCPKVEIAADESVKGITEALLLIKLQAIDLFNIKLVKTAGIYYAKKLAAIAEAAHINCMAGCTIQNTLIDTATAHFLAATKNVVYNEIKAPLWTRNDIATGLRIENGKVIVPDGEGLGLEIDEERLFFCRV